VYIFPVAKVTFEGHASPKVTSLVITDNHEYKARSFDKTVYD